jgi:hypothetical protein
MHAIDGGGRFHADGAGFVRLYGDVFGRPRLAAVPTPLRVLEGGAAGARARGRGCVRERRHLRVVQGGPR